MGRLPSTDHELFKFELQGQVGGLNATEAMRRVRESCKNLGVDDIRSVLVTVSASDWARSEGEMGPGHLIQWNFYVEGYATESEVRSTSESSDDLGIHS